MALDLSILGTERRRWVESSLWPGAAFEIKHAGPEEQEKFRQRLMRDGIISTKPGEFINQGRAEAFFLAYAGKYVTDWRGVRLTASDTEDATFTPERMAEVLKKSTATFEQIGRALSEEADFFPASGNGSTG